MTKHCYYCGHFVSSKVEPITHPNAARAVYIFVCKDCKQRMETKKRMYLPIFEEFMAAIDSIAFDYKGKKTTNGKK